jgi:hypothetical protein
MQEQPQSLSVSIVGLRVSGNSCREKRRKKHNANHSFKMQKYLKFQKKQHFPNGRKLSEAVGSEFSVFGCFFEMQNAEISIFFDFLGVIPDRF